MPIREIENNRRIRAVELGNRAKQNGFTKASVAVELGIPPQLLYTWTSQYNTGDLIPRALGRKPMRVTECEKREIFDLMCHLGPCTSADLLLEFFPFVSRREMIYLVKQFRKRFCEGKTIDVEELTWSHPGSVWAMDYTTPPRPIDGIYKKILDVRDVASGKQLASLPVLQENGFETAMLLESLFMQHGAPLVVKSDNGSTLIAEEVEKVMKKYGVIYLLSPPYYPKYNGSCEAGHGSIKTRAHHMAARAGRPGQWTCDDIEAARVQANELSRPKGHGGPSPNQLWAEKNIVSERDRLIFKKQVADNLRKLKIDVDEKNTDIATKKRLSVSQALVTLGYLLVRRRRIPLRIKSA